MKAPKKLYLRKRCKLPYDVVQYEWYEQPPLSQYGNIEYIRTDAFIEKACKYLEPNVKIILCGDKIDTDKFIEDFKKYMEGE